MRAPRLIGLSPEVEIITGREIQRGERYRGRRDTEEERDTEGEEIQRERDTEVKIRFLIY